MPLCRLAYTDLVSGDTKLVFQKDELKGKIGRPLVEIALKVGLISQTKAPGRFHQQNVSVNFYHKSVQEFLAAIHLTCTDTDDIGSYCTSLDKVMDVANIIMFGVTLDPSLSKHVMEIINADPDIQQYRRTLYINRDMRNRVPQLYNTQCEWYRELNHFRTVTGDTSPPPSLHVTDIYLDRGTVRLTGDLMSANLGTIVSVTLESLWCDPPEEVIELLPRCPNLSALYITYSDNGYHRKLLVSVIPCLTQLTTVRYSGEFWYDAYNRAFVAAVMSLTQLELIQLDAVNLSGDGLGLTDAMTRLRTVVLDYVCMTAEGWDRFLSCLLILPQSVSVRLEEVNIDKGTRRRILTSPRIKVTQDNWQRNFRGLYVRLEFTTSPSPHHFVAVSLHDTDVARVRIQTRDCDV